MARYVLVWLIRPLCRKISLPAKSLQTTVEQTSPCTSVTAAMLTACGTPVSIKLR